MKKKRKSDDSYKRKSNIPGWIAFAIVVAVLIGYLRWQGGDASDVAMRDPDAALDQFAEMAYKVYHQETGPSASIDKLLNLCVEDDKNWFGENYAKIYDRTVARSIGGTAASPIIKRNYVMKTLLGNGVNRSDFKVISRRELNKKIDFEVDIPESFGRFRRVRFSLMRVKKKWYMDGLRKWS